MSRTRTLMRTAPIPANITLDPGSAPIVASGQVTALRDYAYPVSPPRSWFARRKFDAATPLVTTSEGQIYGHGFEWNKPHIGMMDGMMRKVYPPRSHSGYARFMNKHVECDDGTQVKTGVIYIDTDHADLSLSGVMAQSAMANTGNAVADVCIYEDKFGGQIVGALRPHATPAQVRVFRGSDISPDWRKDGGPGHEMFGMISVNLSGFVVPATIAASGAVAQPRKVADGRARILWDFELDEPIAIVAVGMVTHAAPDPLDAIRAELADLRGFAAELRAERVMAGLAGSPAFVELNRRADAARAMVEAVAGGRA